MIIGDAIRKRDVEKVLRFMLKWKLPDIEKQKIKEFINEYRAGRITGRIGKGIEGTLESLVYNLKLPLEYINKEVTEMTEEDIKSFFDALMTNKLRKKVKKRVNGKLQSVNYGDYALKGKIKFFRNFSLYLRFRLDKYPERYVKFQKILKVVITSVDKDPECLTEQEVDKLYESSSELWQRFFHEVNAWGGFRAGEFHQLLESDIVLPDVERGENFVKILIRNETSKTKGRMITLYGSKCHKVVREYLEQRKRQGLKSDEPVFEKGYGPAKIWIRRFGKRVLRKNVHHHLYRHTCATWLVDKGIIKDRHRLCLFFGWKFSSPMPDVYLTRSKISMEDIDNSVKNTELGDLKSELDKERQENRLKQERMESELANLKEELNQRKQVDPILNEIFQKEDFLEQIRLIVTKRRDLLIKKDA